MKNVLGIGQVRNRVPKAVERTVPCGLVCHSLLILLVHPARLPRHRHRAPPGLGAVVGVEDRTFRSGHAHQPPSDHRRPISPTSPLTSHNRRILEVQQAWALAAAQPRKSSMRHYVRVG